MRLFDDDANRQACFLPKTFTHNILKKKHLNAIQEAITLQNPLHIWAVNPHYQILYMNILFHQYIEDLLGVSLRVGNSFLDLPLEPHILRNWRDNYDAALTGESLLVNETLQIPSGTRHISYQLSPLRLAEDNRIWGVIAFATENTSSVNTRNQMLKYQALCKHAERLMNIGFAEWDIEKGELTPHESWLKIHGVSKQKLTLPELMQLAHPEDAKQIASAIEQTLSETKLYNIEHRIIRKDDGQIRIVKAIGEVLKAANGKPLKVFGIVQDITEQKSAHDRYDENFEKYKQLFALISDAVFLIDNETGNILEANKASSALYGYTHQELLTLKNTDLSAEPERTKGATRDRLTAIPVRYHRRKDGAIFPVEITASHYECNERPVHIVAIRDISERLQKETELRQSEKNYRTIFHAASHAMFVLDFKTNLILDANVKASDLFGYRPEEDGKLSLNDLIVFRRESTDRPLSLADLLKQTRQVDDAIEVIGQTRSGACLWLEIAFREIILRDSKCLLVMINDIDKRKRLEAQLIQSQKTELLGSMAGGIAHDFNNLIGAISGYAELMNLKDHSYEIQTVYLRQILKACERAKNLVDQILLFGRHQESCKKPVDIRLVVKEALDLLRVSLKPTIEIRYDVPSEPSPVCADATQLHQVVMNLCTNAAHAMENLTGLITVTVANLDIPGETARISPDLPEVSYAKLQIADNGCGIDPAIMDKIFDPFYTTKGNGKGTGLGLAVVKDIVKKHGGFICVKSERGEGTVFDIYLPHRDE